MKIHIVCPFYRIHLIPSLIHYFEPMGIHFYPMVSPELDIFPKDIDWIHPVHCKELWRVSKEIPGESAFRKVNDFADTQEIIDDDYYCFMTDDDMYEPGFFDVVRQQTAKIIINSVFRGDSIPDSGPEVSRHPPVPMIVNGINDIRPCHNVGLASYVIKGSVFRQGRFSVTDYNDDGHYALRLARNFPNDIVFLPDLWMLAAYFQPGRYTTTDGFIKPNWELPRIIMGEYV